MWWSHRRSWARAVRVVHEVEWVRMDMVWVKANPFDDVA